MRLESLLQWLRRSMLILGIFGLVVIYGGCAYLLWHGVELPWVFAFYGLCPWFCLYFGLTPEIQQQLKHGFFRRVAALLFRR